MSRLTTKLQGGTDAFGTPTVTVYDLDLQTAEGRIKARCALGRIEDIIYAPDGTERISLDLLRDLTKMVDTVGVDRLREIVEAEASGTDALEAAHNELRQVSEQLAAEQITSQSLRNAANGYKLELDAERKKANDARNELCLKCGRYHEAHNGACDGCRWGDVTEGGPQ